MEIRIGIVDDHQLFLKSLALLINSLSGMNVVLEALNGKDLKAKLKTANKLPDIMIVDVNMPVMNGPETSAFIKEEHPSIKLVALSMNADDMSVIRMLRAGCCAYLLKDIHPVELEKALTEVYKKGYYNADAAKQRSKLLKQMEEEHPDVLTEKELVFLRLACSDHTYREIAEELKVAERTVDGYREAVFKKFGVTSRVGMVLEGIRRNLVSL